MGPFVRWTRAGLLLPLALLAGAASAEAGIVIKTAQVQPVGDPYYNVYLELSIAPNTTVNVLDKVVFDSIPYIGNNGINIDKSPNAPNSLVFTNRFDSTTSPFYNSLYFTTSVSDTSLTILFLAAFQAGATPLTVPFHTLGFRTIDFPTDVPVAELTAPLHYTSYANGEVTRGVVYPQIVPEPGTIALVASALPLGALAYGWKRYRARRA